MGLAGHSLACERSALGMGYSSRAGSCMAWADHGQSREQASFLSVL